MTDHDLLADLASMRPRPPRGAIIRFDRHVMAQTFTYAAVYAGGIWYVTGSLKGRRTYNHAELVAILAEPETSGLAVASQWAPVDWIE